MGEYTIGKMKMEALDETLTLIKSVFMVFDAPDYTQQGIGTFLDFIDPGNIRAMISREEILIWTCEDAGRIVGAIALKDVDHVCMLFVDEAYQRRGIAHALMETAAAWAAAQGAVQMTVNSSLFGAAFYRAAGFAGTGNVQEKNGITFIPMRRVL